ncbi:mate-domain-containing protein [Ramicandelaber brevisporus]|nr:mate-domain-containing protein [Ramicandelaber brevisporus]
MAGRSRNRRDSKRGKSSTAGLVGETSAVQSPFLGNEPTLSAAFALYDHDDVLEEGNEPVSSRQVPEALTVDGTVPSEETTPSPAPASYDGDAITAGPTAAGTPVEGIEGEDEDDDDIGLAYPSEYYDSEVDIHAFGTHGADDDDEDEHDSVVADGGESRIGLQQRDQIIATDVGENEPLLFLPAGGRRRQRTGFPKFAYEAKQIVKMVTPISYTAFMINALGFITVYSVSSLGTEALAAYAALTIVSAMAAFSPLYGIATVLETLCSQAYTGASDKRMTGLWFQRGLIIMTAIYIPIATGLWFSAPVLRHLVDPAVVPLTQTAIRAWIPAFFLPAVVDSFKRYLYAQNIVVASVFALTAAVPVHALLCYILVLRPSSSIGLVGVAFSIATAYAVMLIVMVSYMRITGNGLATWGGWSRDAFKGWRTFGRLAVPSTLTMAAEVWALEAVAIGIARLGTLALAIHPLVNMALKVSVGSVLTPMGLASSSRVGNMLGAANARGARRVAMVALCLGAVCSLTISAVLYKFSRNWIELFTKTPETVAFALTIMPLVCMMVIVNGMSTIQDGILRGQGRQKYGFFVKLVSYYVVSLPIGYYAAFKRGYGVVGLWGGMVLGTGLTMVALLAWVYATNWPLEVERCKKRLGKMNRRRRAPPKVSFANQSQSSIEPQPLTSQGVSN